MKKPPTPPRTRENARQLRQGATFPERLLWGRLRAGRAAGLKFRRQHPCGGYVLDFFCDPAQLAIELDGRSHDGAADYDERRTNELAAQGITVIRFHNDDVLRELDDVVEAIVHQCNARIRTLTASPRPPGAPTPLPPGEGGDVSRRVRGLASEPSY